MATPAFLRYLPARLKPLSSPAVWAPLTVFTLLSIFIWEYHKNPDWFNRPQISNVDPDSTLTPEEQARLSEIDTLDLLLRNTRTPGQEDNPSELADLTELGLPDSDSSSQDDRTLAGKDNPFAIYEEQYKFPGTSSSTPNAGSVRAPQVNISTSAASRPNSNGSTGGAASNALSDALNRQAARGNSSLNDGAEQGAAGRRSGSISGDLDTSTGNLPPTSSSPTQNNSADFGTFGSSGSSSFTAPASSGSRIPEPFIRTTTQMSPPVGTTGYQAPAATNLPVFNVPPPQPTRNPFGRSINAPVPTTAPAASTTPTVNYTAPSFTQPEQNQRR